MQGSKLLKIDAETKTFSANGKTYIVENSISFDRWEFYLAEQPALAFGCTIPELAQAFLQIYNAVNDNKMADIAVIARDKLKGLKEINERKTHSALRMAALFINTADENRAIINEDMINQKINDWKMEGLDVTGFFQLALHIIPGFMESLKMPIPGTSKKQAATIPGDGKVSS